MIITSDKVDATAFAARTGWVMKPEGACKGDICVPLPGGTLRDGMLDVAVLADRLGMPRVTNEATGISALGPEAMGHALTTAEAPEIVLPDINGNEFRLSSLRGQKVLVVSWASW